MTIRHRLWIATLALVALLLPTIVQAQGGRSNFDWIVARRITITSTGLTVQTDATIGDDLTVDDAATVTGNLSVGGVAALDELNIAAAVLITPTQGGTLTPLGSFQPLGAAGSVSFGAITADTAGTVLVLYNTVAQNIIISDTGTTRLTGNITLGQYDTLSLVSNGTDWVMTATANN